MTANCANCQHREHSSSVIIEPGVKGVGLCIHYDDARGTQTWVTRDEYWCPLHKKVAADEQPEPLSLVFLLNKIVETKKGSKELALFYFDGSLQDSWRISVGNPSAAVMLGEVPGEIEAEGPTPEAAALVALGRLSD